MSHWASYTWGKGCCSVNDDKTHHCNQEGDHKMHRCACGGQRR